MPAGKTVRFPLAAPFVLHWSGDGKTWQDLKATKTETGIYFADVPTNADQRALRFHSIFIG
jgi:hypothetical protein